MKRGLFVLLSLIMLGLPQISHAGRGDTMVLFEVGFDFGGSKVVKTCANKTFMGLRLRSSEMEAHGAVWDQCGHYTKALGIGYVWSTQKRAEVDDIYVLWTPGLAWVWDRVGNTPDRLMMFNRIALGMGGKTEALEVAALRYGIHNYKNHKVKSVNFLTLGFGLRTIEPEPVILRGADGTNGTDGTAGINGSNGSDGRAGTPGRPGNDGADGTDGNSGRDGSNGHDGERGERGSDGRDGNHHHHDD